eukprot:1005311-Alexandrium_andersonii.AAC.1
MAAEHGTLPRDLLVEHPLSLGIVLQRHHQGTRGEAARQLRGAGLLRLPHHEAALGGATNDLALA